MRITSEVMVMRSLDRLENRLASYERAQSELATGRTLLQPSDDPAGARRSLSLRSALRAREQELKNIDDAQGWLDNADAQLQAVSTRLARVRELATAGASGVGALESGALGAEVRQIAEEIAGIANSRHLDQPLFGGYGGAAAVAKVDAAGAPDPNGTWATFGDHDEIRRRVSDSETVRVNVTAAEWLGMDGPDDDLLTVLDELAASLEAGDAVAVTDRLADVIAASSRVGAVLGEVGAATNRIESARSRATDLSLTLRTELSTVEDVDVAQGIMELQVQQVAYEATLQALGKALPPSLVAFLR